MTRTVIRGGRVIDATGERLTDVAVEHGLVAEIGAGFDGDVLEAGGCIVAPGFVDLHAHLREPGGERAETIDSGTAAAAAGGYTAVVAMPNTDPAADTRSVIDFVTARARAAGHCEVVPAGCITVGRHGRELAPFAELAAAGVRLFTDDGAGVQDPLLMRRALEYARGLDIVLAQHCEVSRLTEGAVMHEGECCSRLGVPGWPALAEELMLHRDIELVRLTGTPMHFLHLSTAGSVALVKAAKVDRLPVTAEVSPHHLSLTDELLASFDADYKVNPPLRTMADVKALRAGLADGTIDAIATDHAPHTAETKEQPLDIAPPGMLGLETALGVALSHLDMPLADVLAAMSWKPAAIAGVDGRHGGPIEPGRAANLVVFDADERWEVAPVRFASLSRNTPYRGVKLRGRVRHTLYEGRPSVRDGVVL
ncbi:MAG: dihydroorotase [Actinomycetota bacterium]|nr:dihydroorotase [Actinomycetota bacterium]